eukprot:CAMPEP_0204469112 /NCGR_PEP_ID=MMETSP0471-20130131/13129_1 /ASSEMBLY_ACC=CAM_ASM_000602 /TAXON_ID=2969 /ORGANISM="Oxyrrhis marina" /LENGTH=35 /DNA_ID= /DNA_START= /DNA_END= /DNA_ORIENTATION=
MNAKMVRVVQWGHRVVDEAMPVARMKKARMKTQVR